jgi:hypothetical protein
MATRAEMLDFLLVRKFPGADIARLRVQATEKEMWHTLADADWRAKVAAYDVSLRALSPEDLEAKYQGEYSKLEEDRARVSAALVELAAREEQSRVFNKTHARAF